jgi:hypothetical protein
MIEENAFYGLSQLVDLKMQRMCSEAKPLLLDSRCFNGLTNLRQFILQDSKARLVNERFFDVFPKLSEIYIRDCGSEFELDFRYNLLSLMFNFLVRNGKNGKMNLYGRDFDFQKLKFH